MQENKTTSGGIVMSKRKYTHRKTAEALILSMRQDGMTLQEFADKLGLRLKQMKNWSYRHNCEKRNLLKEIAPSPKGRPRKDGQPPKQNKQKELARLRMENKLLRDFLQFTGSEAAGKMPCDLHESRVLSSICHVPVFRGVSPRILRLCTPTGAQREGCIPGRNYSRKTESLFLNIRLPSDVAGKPGDPTQPQDNTYR